MVRQAKDGAIPEMSVIVADRVESLDHLIILYVRLIPIGRRRADAFRAMSLASPAGITSWMSE
jgi:hypothetical protein